MQPRRGGGEVGNKSSVVAVGETQVVYLGLLTGLNNGGLKMVE